MSGGTDKKVQVKAAKMAKLAVLDVIGLVNNIKVGNRLMFLKTRNSYCVSYIVLQFNWVFMCMSVKIRPMEICRSILYIPGRIFIIITYSMKKHKMYLIFFTILSNVYYFPLAYITPSKRVFFFKNWINFFKMLDNLY